MLRKALILTAISTALAGAMAAHASGDYGPSPSWKLAHRDLNNSSNMAIIGPGNDTRTNMFLLFSDRAGGAKPIAKAPYSQSLFDWGSFRDSFFPLPEDADSYNASDSRCTGGARDDDDFVKAVRAETRISSDDKSTLILAREARAPACAAAASVGPAEEARAFNPPSSPLGKDFASYLKGAESFYESEFTDATARFAELQSSGNAWIREVSTYMLGRTKLKQAMAGALDEWGDFDRTKVKKGDAAAAGQALTAYLTKYPKGLYAESARGLQRRVAWIGGDITRLASEYGALIGANPAPNYADLAEEIDLKLLPWVAADTAVDPALLATIDLKRMRAADSLYDEGLMSSPISLAELQAQKPRFANNNALYDYLVATHQFYIGENPKEVLRLIPDDARNSRFSYLDFSRQMLRGMALEAAGDRNARGFWHEMIGGAKQPYQRQGVELAIAMHDERSGNLDAVFAPASEVRDPSIREILLTSVAGADLLRSRAKDAKSGREGKVALYTLLYKSLTHGAYRDFVSDVKMVPAGADHEGSYWGLDYWDDAPNQPIPLGQFVEGEVSDGYACPKIADTALALSLNPRQSHALLCLGDFLRLNGFDQYWMAEPREKDELGGSKRLFAGSQIDRMDIYQGLIADPGVKGEDKAYALYRAVWCYGPSGSNSCGGDEVPESQRKAWHDRLKRDYPASRWAKSLKYYW